MKTPIVYLILSIFMAFAMGQDKESIAKVSFPIGKNYIQNQGSQRWHRVRYYMPVYEKDKVKTEKDSRCEVTFINKKVMRIGANSVAEITRDDAGIEEVKMSRGFAWLSIFLPKGTTKLRVRTPSSVCAIRGTVYRLDCDTVHTTYRCYQGTIKVTPFKKDGKTLADSSFAIGSGEELVVVSNFEEYKRRQEKEIQDYEQQQMDEFERFKQQDQQEFNDMVENDLKEFQQMDNISFKHSNFDVQKDAQSDWVQWNKERDKLINQ